MFTKWCDKQEKVSYICYTFSLFRAFNCSREQLIFDKSSNDSDLQQKKLIVPKFRGGNTGREREQKEREGVREQLSNYIFIYIYIYILYIIYLLFYRGYSCCAICAFFSYNCSVRFGNN